MDPDQIAVVGNGYAAAAQGVATVQNALNQSAGVLTPDQVTDLDNTSALISTLTNLANKYGVQVGV